MSDSPDTTSYRPKWWYWAATAAASVAFLAIARQLIDFDNLLFVVVPAVTAIGMPRLMTMSLTASGVTVARHTAEWHSVELRHGRFGTSLRTVKGTPVRAGRVNVLLPIYETDWRNGRIGDDLQRWAPDLLLNQE